METVSFTLTGDVNVAVTITEHSDGSLNFDLAVLDDTGSIADLNGLFFDLMDDSILSGISVTGDDITGTAMTVDGVTKVSGYNNINGEVVKEYDKFDIGIEFGTSGIGTDDIRATSFTLSHDTMDLTLETFLAQDFAVRLTSVGEEDGSREGSLKIGGTAPTDPDEPAESTYTAVNDTMTVDKFELFDLEGSDTLDSGALSVLANDMTDTFAYEGDVLAANGSAMDVGQVIVGSNGGVMIIMPDGSVDFANNGDFLDLGEGQSAQTEFTYSIEGDATATITVTVEGSDEGGGGGGGGDNPFFEDVFLA